MNKKIEFKPSDDSLDSKCIGCLINTINHENLLKRLKKNKPKVIEIASYPNQLHSLEYEAFDSDSFEVKKKKLLFISDVCSIKVLDEEFKLVKTTNSIDNKPISPSCLTSNQLDSLFISDLNDETIILCDFNFKLIKRIGGHGDLVGQFDHISDLTYSNHCLYACDTYNQRIQCFDSSDLSFLNSLQFDYEPYQLKIYNKIACVLGSSFIYFYDLNCFNLIRKYDCGDCTIDLINTHFLIELSYDENYIQFYSLLNAERLHELNETLKDLKIVDYDDRRCITSFNDKLIISLSQSRQIFVF